MTASHERRETGLWDSDVPGNGGRVGVEGTCSVRGLTSLDSDKDMIIGRQQGAGAGRVQGAGPTGSWGAGLVDSR